MSRNQSFWIADIITACDKILRYTNGMDQERFVREEAIQDAVLRNIEVLGEASKRLSKDVKDRLPNVEWKKIAGMRDWLSHVYFNVDSDVVWDVVENKIPDLERQLAEFVAENET